MNVDSLYKFQMRVGYAVYSAIFFQLKERGGDMKRHGGGRPAISLNLKNEKDIFITINSEFGRVLKEKIATLDCPQVWYDFKIRVIWNRDYPFVDVAINGGRVFKGAFHFGAHNSKNHYSKFGIYIPTQKFNAGTRDTMLIFDNVEETHRRFVPPTLQRPR